MSPEEDVRSAHRRESLGRIGGENLRQHFLVLFTAQRAGERPGNQGSAFFDRNRAFMAFRTLGQNDSFGGLEHEGFLPRGRRARQMPEGSGP